MRNSPLNISPVIFHIGRVLKQLFARGVCLTRPQCLESPLQSRKT